MTSTDAYITRTEFIYFRDEVYRRFDYQDARLDKVEEQQEKTNTRLLNLERQTAELTATIRGVEREIISLNNNISFWFQSLTLLICVLGLGAAIFFGMRGNKPKEQPGRIIRPEDFRRGE